jgi:hypothetical protein
VTLQLVTNWWSDEENKELQATFVRVNRFGAYPKYGTDVWFLSLRGFALKAIW